MRAAGLTIRKAPKPPGLQRLKRGSIAKAKQPPPRRPREENKELLPGKGGHHEWKTVLSENGSASPRGASVRGSLVMRQGSRRSGHILSSDRGRLRACRDR